MLIQETGGNLPLNIKIVLQKSINKMYSFLQIIAQIYLVDCKI